MSKYTPHRREVENAWAHRFNDMDVNNIEQYDAEIDRFIVSIRAAALDEAAEVAKAEGHKWHERWMDSDREESLVGRRYADYRDTALALASAIRALKEEKK